MLARFPFPVPRSPKKAPVIGHLSIQLFNFSTFQQILSGLTIARFHDLTITQILNPKS